MCVNILYKLYYYTVPDAELNCEWSNWTYCYGGKGKRIKVKSREWSGNGRKQVLNLYPTVPWALISELSNCKNKTTSLICVLTLQKWGSQARNQPVKVGGSDPCLMIRMGVWMSRPLGWVCRYSWAVARALSFSVALASAPIHKNTCCGTDLIFVNVVRPRTKY